MRVCVCVCVFVCVCVCSEFADFISSLYCNLDLPVYFSLDFLGFQLADFDKTLSFQRYSDFHAYFVVSGQHKWLRILLAVRILS